MENNVKTLFRIYLDDVRTPTGDDWIIVRDYDEFVKEVNKIGLENISTISLDHDLGDSAMKEYFGNVSPNYTLDYNNINEKTGYDVAKFLVALFHNTNEGRFNMTRSERKINKFVFPTVYVHSANPIGSANIMGYLNNFYMNEGQAQTCVRVKIPHV
jgi:predicted ATP-grasp superfamily ATP-dependent carboligase